MACQASSIASTGVLDHSASATRASRAETPTRKPPVSSLISASRPLPSSVSSQPAISAGTSDLGVVSKAAIMSDSAGGGAFTPARFGQISAMVSARSPT